MKKILIIPILVIVIVILYIGFHLPKSSTLDLGWNLVLVNNDFFIPFDYDLKLVQLDNHQQVDKRIYADLNQMIKDMNDEGIYPTVSSGYRTIEDQYELLIEKMDGYKEVPGQDLINRYQLARHTTENPYFSEHHLGIAVDFWIDGAINDLNPLIKEMYAWLQQNAHQYGFIQRYPSGKESITKYNVNDFHYRYVGKEHATYMYENNLCLEEYVEMLKEKDD